MQVIEEFSEGSFSEDYFLEKLKFLDFVFYGDMVEERSGNCFCGYPICGNKFKPRASKYRISCTYNKVKGSIKWQIFAKNQFFFDKLKFW